MLRLDAVSHTYGKKTALAGCSLALADGARAAIIGPSGCGKSTLLRIIVGLEIGHTGSVHYRGRDITALPTHLRGIGLMFQDHALFPHLTVAANIAYGLYGQPAAQIAARVAALARLFDVESLLQRLPEQLSGGERQRVALARSIAPSPGLLLLDEPFAALDRTLRDRFLRELPTQLHREGVSTIYVTHDPADAMLVADTLIVMRAGQIVRHDTPSALFRDPQTTFVAELLGLRTAIACVGTATECTTVYGAFPIAAPAATQLLIRPTAGIDAHQHPHSDIDTVVSAVAPGVVWPVLTLTHRDGSAAFTYDWPFGTPPAPGTALRVALRHDCLAALTDDTDVSATGTFV
jgi:ABC-type Fe3+/spermidine/putrescine transport system ATPase subunit